MRTYQKKKIKWVEKEEQQKLSGTRIKYETLQWRTEEEKVGKEEQIW